MHFISQLRFVDKQPEGGDIYTFYFEKPKGFQYRAGQHCLFLLPGMYRPHPFSLSSAPEEKYVTFTTHIRPGSRFKQKLMRLTSHDAIIMVGPILRFTFQKAPHHVLLAQGIGITPFRSMLVHAHETHLPESTSLIHVQNEPHTFRNLTEKYADQAVYVTSPENFQEAVKNQSTESMFYLSGSPKFVATTKKLLRDMHVNSDNVKTDSFLGY